MKKKATLKTRSSRSNKSKKLLKKNKIKAANKKPIKAGSILARKNKNRALGTKSVFIGSIPARKGKRIKRKTISKARFSTRKSRAKSKVRSVSVSAERSQDKTRIVRIMGQGQFTVDNHTLKRLNEIDDSIVELVNTHRSDDSEFKRRLTELTNVVENNGQPLDPREIIQSDIILPSADLSIDEAKSLFKGEGVIPGTEL